MGALVLVTDEGASGPEVVRIGGSACGRYLLGTGFVVDDLVVTNAHVVAGASELTVTRRFGSERQAVVVAFDPAADLAALKFEDGKARSQAVRFADVDAGDTGSVMAQEFEVRRRIRAHIGDIYGDQAVIRPSLEIAADITDGDSGAPLVTDDGAVVGVVYANSRGKERTAYAIRSPEIEAFLGGVGVAHPPGGPCR